MNEAVIVSACRTAIGAFGGTLSTIGAAELGATVVREAVRRSGIPADAVEQVVMGQVLQAGLGQHPARQAALRAGLPLEVSTYSVNKMCGSGLKAACLAGQAIQAEQADIVVAGGMENMSRAPFLLPMARFGLRLGHGQVVDAMIHDGLWDVSNDYHMGITAENLAEKYGISREEQDSFAAESQERYAAALSAGAFADEIVPVEVPQGKKDPIQFRQDEHPRPGTTVEKLASLKPAFKKGGTVTAGNASGISDGAAAVLVMSRRQAEARGLEPLASIRAYSSAGVDPAVMGIAPVHAARQALAKAGLSLGDMDLMEFNEAFAAQSLAVGRELQWDAGKVNVHGGAIALGHPIGASGARILVTLLHAMARRNVRYGLAALCIGGGEGIAMIVERNSK